MKKIIIIVILILSLLGFSEVQIRSALKKEENRLCELYNKEIAEEGKEVSAINVILGRYNGLIIVKFYYRDMKKSDAQFHVGHLFFSEGEVYACKKDEIYQLKTAYELELLTLKQVAKIQLKYNENLYLRRYGIPKYYI